jgi:CMP-N,N'-diacetyllegionaminic acid synthase
MNTICAIFARGGSKGIPRKNLKELHGKPLIEWTIECAKKCDSIDRIIVSTDDNEIAEVAKNCGVDVPFFRPSELSGSSSPRWKAWKHLVDYLKYEEKTKVDYLVDLQTTSPIRKVADVEGCLKKLKQNHSADGVITVFEPNRNPYFNMVELETNKVLAISKPSEKRPSNRHEAPTVYAISTSCYVLRGSFASKGIHLLDGDILGHTITTEYDVDLDTNRDWLFAEFAMQELEKNNEIGMF